MSKAGWLDPEAVRFGIFEPETQLLGILEEELVEEPVVAAAAVRPNPVVKLQAIVRGSVWALIGILLRLES